MQTQNSVNYSNRIRKDTWSSLATTHQVKTGGVDDARLAPPGKVHLESHLEEHEC